MHRIFGKKKAMPYFDRRGAYIVPFREEKIALVKTPRGYFLIGGGIEENETHAEAIVRECMEETGCRAEIGKYVCSAETYTFYPKFGHYHPIQAYYLGEISDPVQSRQDEDHRLVWAEYADMRGKLCLEMQNWALEMCRKAFEEMKNGGH